MEPATRRPSTHPSHDVVPRLTGAVLSAIFFVVWVLLLPIKCCCPGGSIVACLEWIFTNLVKLPVNVVNWALK